MRLLTVRFMNQGKLEEVKQDMERVNIDTLGISELKWTRMDEFNQMTIISTTAGKNLLEENVINNHKMLGNIKE